MHVASFHSDITRKFNCRHCHIGAGEGDGNWGKSFGPGHADTFPIMSDEAGRTQKSVRMQAWQALNEVMCSQPGV